MTLISFNHPAVLRFAGKLADDLIPAAVASALAGVLIAHFGWTGTPRANASAATPEMVQVLRDEHALVLDYLKKDSEARAAAARTADAEFAEMKVRAAREAAERRAVATPPVVTTVAALAPAKPARKLAARDAVPLPPQPPLQLQAMMTPLPAAPVRRDGPVIERVRGMVSAVERIPGWLGNAADWVAELPSKALPRRFL